jgi:hypothetical protein
MRTYRHDRRRARRWTTAAAAAAAGLAAWLLFFRGAGAAPDAAAAVKEPAPPAAAETPKPAPAPEKKPAPPAKKVDAPVQPKPVPVSVAPEPRPEPPKPVGEAPWKYLLDSGRHHEARRHMAEAFAATDSDALRAEIAEKGIALNKRLLLSQSDPRDVEFVTIAPGENPTSVARRVKSFRGEPGLLFVLNGMRPGTVIRAGAKLRVTRGTWSLAVDKSLFKIWLCYEGVPFREYPVCVGYDDKTPATAWTVGDKIPKPTWTAPPEWLEKEKGMRNPIEYGHPKNPLGEYWLTLEAGGFQGFGIHGTNEPHTMGSKASNGCVRMLNSDVVELAGCVYKGMAVTTME